MLTAIFKYEAERINYSTVQLTNVACLLFHDAKQSGGAVNPSFL